jgi:16S rRNA (adenine(1408)-N(1))-methyltransferase
VKVLDGRLARELSRAELDGLLAGRRRVVLDAGAGDGRFAYRRAAADPTAFVIALDPVKENMEKIAARAARKPARGGLANLVLVWGTLESAAPELAAVATGVHVVLPWGSLLRGLVERSPSILGPLRRIARPGASIDVVLNAEPWNRSVPADLHDLPAVDLALARETLAPAYLEHGIEITETGLLSPEEVGALDSSWSRRLAHGRHPAFVYLRGRAR